MNQPSISFEFYPPRDEKGWMQLRTTAGQLQKFSPEYFSVTFGAGGSTQEGTLNTVTELTKQTGIPCAPHISCMSSEKSQINALLEQYIAHGITRIVALRGDIPSGMGRVSGELRYANELVAFIREMTGSHFHIEVGAYPEIHPESDSVKDEMKYFKQKVDAGADGVITQYFYNPDAYFRFVDSARDRGVTVPIVPGIMPITNYKHLMRFSDNCGAEVPRWIQKRLQEYADHKESLLAFGHEVVTNLCDKLIDSGVPGLHFYTLNRYKPTRAIIQDLKLR